MEVIETSTERNFVGSSCYNVEYKLPERQPGLLMVLSIMAVDTDALVACLTCSFTKSISL